ncbi:MAG: NADPH-dependent F420 reductase [Candidatus Hadarchaeales archaeon]
MIAIIGGSGELGRGLAERLALSGESVIIGSRSPERGMRAAEEIAKKIGKKVEGGSNRDAAERADIVVLSIPFEGLEEIAEEVKDAVKGKIVVSVIVPIKFGKVLEYFRPPAGSAAEEVSKALPEAKVVSAFHTVGAKQLQNLDAPIKCDVVVCGDDERSKRRVMEMIEKIEGMRAVDGGPLQNSRLVEATVALLIELTRRYRVPGVSIRFEGI